jgi:hypothetical protein
MSTVGAAGTSPLVTPSWSLPPRSVTPLAAPDARAQPVLRAQATVPTAPLSPLPAPTLREDPAQPGLLQTQPGAVEVQRFANLEQGARGDTNAIVLHMTGGSAAGTLETYRNSSVGAQFLITRDGKIIQTSNMEQENWHVGRMRPKGYQPTANGGNQRIDADLTAAAQAILDKMEAGKLSFGAGLRQLAALEAAKPYGNDPHDENTRGPMNADSVGIEFEASVGRDGKYQALTDAQISAGKALVDFLKARYGLSDADVYEHPKVSYKDYTEALGAAEQIRTWRPPR